MPLSNRIAKANRNGFNRLSRRFAGRCPPFANLHHVGRTSGTAYTTPIIAFRRGDGFVVCLTYGPDTDWLRNIEANNKAELEYGGRRWRLGECRLVHGSPLDQPLPKPVQVALSAFRVKDFLHVQADEPEAR